jgi:hypothetical protein
MSDPGSKNCNKITQNWKLFYFLNAKENNFCQFSKNYRTSYPKNCQQALKNMGLGSGIRKQPFPDPGVKKAPDPGSATLVYIKFLTFINGHVCVNLYKCEVDQ